MSKAQIESVYPLAPIQQGILFHCLSEPSSGVYVEQARLGMKGLDAALFRRAWQQVFARHQVLRTSIVTASRRDPAQVVHRTVSLPIEEHDLRERPEAEQQSWVEQFAEEDRRRGFVLKTPPLMRLALLRLSEDEYEFLWTYHHILLDGWSVSRVAGEVFQVYAALCAGRELDLPEPRPYRDFIVWLHRQDEAAAEGHWRALLRGFEQPTQIAVDRAEGGIRPEVSDYTEGAVVLSVERTRQLRAQAARFQVTLNTMMLGAWSLLLCRYGGGADVVFGTTVSGRPADLPGAQDMVGVFINTLPMRCRLPAQDSLESWLQTLQGHQVDLRDYEYSPLWKVQQWSDVSNDVRLFESLVVFENYPIGAAAASVRENGRLEFTSRPRVSRTGFPLMLLVLPGERLSAQLVCDSDRFDATVVQEMARHLEQILESMIECPQARLAEVSMLSPAERLPSLVSGQPSIGSRPGRSCLHQLFEARAGDAPDKRAILFGSDSLSYGDLETRSNQLAQHLGSMGVGTGDRVGIHVERGLDMLVALLGVLKSGAAYVPLDPDFPASRLGFMLEDSQVRVLLTSRDLASTLPDHEARVLCLDTDWPGIAEHGVERPDIGVGPDDLAYLIYTSGSTGRPKGVEIPHRAAVNFLESMSEQPGLGEADVLLSVTTLSFDIAVLELFLPLSVGASIVLSSRDEALDGATLARHIAEHGVTVLQATPTTWRLLIESGWSGDGRLKALVGGEAWNWELAEGLLERCGSVWNMYGPTETTVWSAVRRLRSDDGRVLIGAPIADTQLHVLDPHGQPVPVGVHGELTIGGAGLARGYWQRPDLTTERFVADPFAGPSAGTGQRMYRTGDLVRRLADGGLEFLGRMDSQVKLRGYRIELGEIESQLTGLEGVRDAVAMVREDTPGDQRLVVYVVPRDDVQLSASVLRAALHDSLPGYMVPSAYVMLDALPLTPNNKVDRKALPEPDSDRPQLAGPWRAPESPVAQILADIWADVLGVANVSSEDHFFHLGGHSLLATQIVSRVRDALQVEVPIVDVFVHPTLAQLARRVDALVAGGEAVAGPPISPVDRSGELPVSFSQQRLWFLDRLHPGSTAYNISGAIRLRGSLDRDALESSLTEILRRHETLRTTFREVDGRPTVAISEPSSAVVPLIDLSGRPDAEREAESRRLVSEAAAIPFDLTIGPLLRMSLLRLGDDEHVLVVVVHHIVADAWSLGVLLSELSRLYETYREGRPSPLPDLPVQYVDFAAWQRDQGDLRAGQLYYWKRQLDGAPAALVLPTDHPRPSTETFEGAREHTRIPPELVQKLQATSRDEGVTLFATLIAAFKALMYRYTGQSDIVIGTPIAGRSHAELEGLLGFFANNLVLRSVASDDTTFREFLSSVWQVVLGAFAHQDVPFEQLVEELHPVRDTSRHPLFQVMFSLENEQHDPLELSGLSLQGMPVEGSASPFDLMLFARETKDGLVLGVQYKTALFEAPTIRRMLGHYRQLLEAIVEDVTCPLSRLALLTGEEQRDFDAWNATATDVPRESCVHELFERQAARAPERVAVVAGAGTGDEALTYGELDQRANQLAHALRDLGARPGERVGVCVERGLSMTVALLGVLKSGAAYVPLDPGFPSQRLGYMLEDSGCCVLVTTSGLEQLLPEGGAPRLRLDTDHDAIAVQRHEPPDRAAGPGDLAYLIYTSGSTGRPKGVEIPHRAVVNFLHSMGQEPGLGPEDVLLSVTTLSFDIAVLELFLPLSVGARVVLSGRDEALDGATLAGQLTDHGVTVMQATPTTWRLLLQSGWSGDSRLKALVGGEAWNWDLAQALLTRCGSVWNMYGPTETTVWSAVRHIRPDDGRVLVGRPIANTQLHVLDPARHPVPVGVPGELNIGGDGLARGYWQRPELTAECFIDDASAGDGRRLYRTGDLVRRLADGSLEFLGRIDTQVKLRGYRIELGEIEVALNGHPAVEGAVVLVREDTPGDQRLVAYLVPDGEVAPAPSALRELLQESLPDYMVPSAFVTLDVLPLTPNRKVDRAALPAPAGAVVDEQRTWIAPEGPVEESLASLFGKVLGVDRVGGADNFFELGGHSLLATQVVARIRDALHIEVPVADIFKNPTPADLARVVSALGDGSRGRNPPQLESVPRDVELPLSFQQQRVWFLDQLDPGSSAYNMQSVRRLRGQLDREALHRSIQAIVDRHEVLRTTFQNVDGRPRCSIAESLELQLPFHDLSKRPEPESAEHLARLIDEDAKRPFDLSVGPLIRAGLVQLAEDEHVFLLTIHHIVTDGWSMAVLQNELVEFYRAYRVGAAPGLRPLERSYADYASWQRNWLQGEVLDEELSYWRDTLGGGVAFEMPTDRPRPSVQSSMGATVTATIGQETVQGLRAVAAGENATLFMTLVTAFKVLLMRHSGQQDIVIGTPISGRNHTAVERLIGFFINTLVLRTDLSGNPSFRELLRRVRDVTVGAYRHQEVPFEKLVEQLQPERDLSRNPLFQVFVNQVEAAAGGGTDSEANALPGLRSESVGELHEVSKFDLTLYLYARGDELTVWLNYNVDLFESETMRAMLRQFSTLLEAVATDPDQQIMALPLLTSGEFRQLAGVGTVDVLDHPFEPFGAGDVELSIGARFAAQVARGSERIAVQMESAAWTYGELDALARRTAAAVTRAAGAAGPQRVALLFDPGGPMLSGLMGVLMSGHAYVPLDPAYPEAWLRSVLEDTGAAVILTQGRYAGLAQELARSTPVIDLEALSDEAPIATLPAVSPDALAYIRYTSGSTGRPKGVMQSHRGLLAHIRAYINSLHIDAEDKLTFLSSYSYDGGLMDIYAALLSGATLCPMPLRERTPDETLGALESLGVTIYHSTSSAFRHLFGGRSEARPLPAVRLVVFGGEETRPGDVKLFRRHFGAGCWLVNGLGCTESSQALQAFLPHDTVLDRQRVPVGRPIDGTEVVLLGPDGEETDVFGEIGIRSDHVALGYWNDPQLTAAAFSGGPPGRGQLRLYRSGDMARRLPDGRLEWMGRRDDQIKVRGHRVETGEIAAVLRSLDGVADAGVAPKTTETGETRLVGYVVTEQDAVGSAGAWRAELRARLPEHMVPASVVTLAALPMTPAGKLDRRALPEPEWSEAQREGGFLAPRTHLEEQLTAIYAEVLGIESVGASDHFFELGGHSLLATRVVSRVRDRLDVELPLLELFEQPIVADLAARIEARRSDRIDTTVRALLPVPADAAPVLSFGQQRFWFLERLQPGTAAYNMHSAVRLEGELDPLAWGAALSEIVRRHAPLRTSFPEGAGGEPAVRVVAPGPVDLPLIDLSSMEEREARDELKRLSETEAATPFDVEQGPLLRARLVRLGPDEHAFLFTVHHIVFDAWSMGVFWRELIALSGAFSGERPSPLAEPTIGYGDFAYWQRRWLADGERDAELAWWRDTLGSEPSALDLPTDLPRPRIQQFVGAHEMASVDPGTVRGLRLLAQQENASLFMVLLAAFKVLLMRSSGTEDIVVGTPISGRNHTEVENLIGFFISTLVLRNDLSGAPGFRELLGRVRRSTLEAFDHQEIPFEKLVEELQPERDLSRNPLFQIFVNLIEGGGGQGTQTPGLRLESVGGMEEVAKFDLTLYLFVSGDTVSLRLNYNVDLFESRTVQAMLRQYATLLDAIAADADQVITALPLVSPDERLAWSQRRLADVVTAPFVPFDAHEVESSIGERFAAQVARAPDQIAVRTADAVWTYAEVDGLARRTAAAVVRALDSASAAAGESQRVALLFDPDGPMLAGLMGVLMSGHAYVPLDPSYPEAWLRHVLEDTGAALVVTQGRHVALAGELLGAARVLDVDSLTDDSPGAALPSVSPDALAYIRYTSGTTGRPKGVMQSHRGLLAHIRAYTNSLHIDAGDTLSFLSSYTYDGGLMDLYAALLNGATLCPVPLRERSPEETRAVLESLGVTIYHSTPSAFRYLLADRAEPAALPAVRLVVFGGEESQPGDVALFQRHFGSHCWLVNGLGCTESSQALQAWLPQVEPLDRQRVPVGLPIDGTEVVLLGPDGEETDVFGEIGIRSDHLALGYWNDEQLTAAAFSGGAAGRGRMRLYRSGDLGRRLPDGRLEWLGRRDEQIKVRGHRVEPGEIAMVLRSLDGVADGGVAAKTTETGELRLVGYVALHEGAATDPASLRQELRALLPEHMVPATLMVLDALPITPAGKLDRSALPEPEWSEVQRVGEYIPPATGTEERLAAVFADVLGVEGVGSQDHFFELGGHSLLAMQVVSRVRDEFDTELPLIDLFEHPTVCDLAARIDELRERGAGSDSGVIEVAPPGSPTVLSFGQQRFWFLEQLQPGTAALNMHSSLRLAGALHTEALWRALGEILRRHSVLRAAFPEGRDGEPLFRIAEAGSFEMTETDLATVDDATREQQLIELATQEARTPFDVAAGPLLRARLVRMSEDEHVFLLTQHHIVGDAWSMSVFWREFVALYSAFAEGLASPLAELPIQYSDFTRWQRAWLADERLGEQLDYWTAHLTGAPPLLELPTDRPRPAVEAFEGARCTRVLDTGVAHALAELARQQDVTLFMVLMSGFCALLQRYTTQSDIVLGVPTAGRTRVETEDLIGLFVNSLVLRTDLSGDPTFVDLLMRVRGVSLGAFAHQELPFERLVQELQPPRDLSHHPVFQVMFVQQNAPRSQVQLPGLELRPGGTERTTSQFDLTLFAVEARGEIAFTAEYKTALFDEATIQGMLQHLETLLKGVAAEPGRRLSEVSLLGEDERRHVLETWNDTAVDVPTDETLHGMVERQVARTPDAVAVEFGGERLTYAELDTRACGFARRLAALGIGRGARVGLCVERGLGMLEALLGILKAGAAYVPLDPTHPEERLSFILSDAEVDALVTEAELAGRLDIGDVPEVLLDGEDPVGDGAFDAGTTPDDLAYVIYTSGSTGRPKGVEILHATVVNFLSSMTTTPGLDATDVMLSVTTLSFDIAVLELFAPLTVGARVVLASTDDVSDGMRLEARMSQSRATVCQATPATWRLLLEAQWPGDRRLKALCGGEAWSRALADELLPRCGSLWNMYGPTETTVWSAVQQVEAGTAPVAIGAPIANTRLYVLDEHTAPLPVGVPGELCIAGAGLARGYWNRPELTADRFVADPFGAAPGERLYRTGDLVRRRPDGSIAFLGRLDHQVKVQGHRIELEEIEAVLATHPDLRELVVTVHEFGPGDSRLVAYVVADPERAPAAGDLQTLLRERLPEYMVPGLFMPLDALPRTPNGKINRSALPAPERARRTTEAELQPISTPLEKQLAAIWQELLGVDEVSALDNFFDLGGHSLLSMRVVARLEQETGVRIGPGELILQTLGQVAAICERAQARRAAGATVDVPASGAGDRPGWLRRLLRLGRSPRQRS